MTNISGDLAVTTLVAKWNDAVDFTSGTRAAGDEAIAPADDD